MIDLKKRTAIAVTLLLSMFMAACSVYDDEPKRPVIPEGAVTGTKVSIEEAEKTLISFLNEEPMTRSGKARTIASKFSLGGVLTKADGEEEEEPLVHVFNFENDEGFAILSGDRRTSPILCVIDEGSLTEDAVVDDPGFAMMLSELDTYYRLKTGLPVTDSLGNVHRVKLPDPGMTDIDTSGFVYYGDWENYSSAGTIIDCEWDQNGPFNGHCPMDYGDTTLVGCVPIAVAQIMYYWGKNVYYNGEYWDWSKMRRIKNYQSSEDLIEEWLLVKRFLRVLGTPDNLEANYGFDKTGASIDNVARTFENFSYVSGGSYEDYDYDKLVKQIVYGPALGSGHCIKEVTKEKLLGVTIKTHIHYKEGHSWVFDKTLTRRRNVTIIENNVETNKTEYQRLVHINMGWGNENRSKVNRSIYSNGYYLYSRFDANVPLVTRGTETFGSSYFFQYDLKMNCGIRAY